MMMIWPRNHERKFGQTNRIRFWKIIFNILDFQRLRFSLSLLLSIFFHPCLLLLLLLQNVLFKFCPPFFLLRFNFIRSFDIFFFFLAKSWSVVSMSIHLHSFMLYSSLIFFFFFFLLLFYHHHHLDTLHSSSIHCRWSSSSSFGLVWFGSL